MKITENLVLKMINEYNLLRNEHINRLLEGKRNLQKIHFDILEIIFHKQPTTHVDLRALFPNIQHRTLRHYADRLERLALTRTQTDPTNQRRNLLHTTNEGVEFYFDLIDLADQVARQRFPKAKVEIRSRIVERIVRRSFELRHKL